MGGVRASRAFLCPLSDAFFCSLGYRNERRGRGNSGFSFSFFQGGYTGPSIENREENVRRQTQHNAKQKAEYEQRLREFGMIFLAVFISLLTGL
jgi:hypothetical protein